MGQRNSEQDQTSTNWRTVGVKLGRTGLDLREPAEPESLAKLINARFEDDRTIVRRRGHTGRRNRDGANFPPLGNTYRVSGDWVYGHGATVSSENAASWENAHHPFPNRGEGTFNFEGADVLWTGDRLLVTREGNTALGDSTFWHRVASPSTRKYGIPAYLPLATDSTPPSSVSGEYIGTALTPEYRLQVHTNEDADTLTAWLIDRETGAVVDTRDVSGSADAIVECVALNSNGIPVVLFRDETANELYINHWTGVGWDGATLVHADVFAFDVVTVSGGFYLIWREGAPSDDVVKVGYYSGANTRDTPFPFGTELDGIVPTGPVSIDVAPNGEIGVLAVSADGLEFRTYNAALTADIDWTIVDANTTYPGGITVRARGLRSADGTYPWVIHYSRGNDTGVVIKEATIGASSATFETDTRFNSALASKSFRVGDEVFCWLRAGNAGTHYLVGGAPNVQVCGFADREEAILRGDADGNYGIPHVWPDPLDDEGLTFTWSRPYNTGQEYDRGGNVRIGDIDFLPAMTSVQFGRSVYLSGSAVRNWDGVQLGDAGFQNYPTVKENAQGTTGELTATGTYNYRVYAVRYNRRGERFMSAAINHGPVELTGSNDSVTLTINTLPDTNHDDVVFEVYRTESLLSAFYLEGTVANDRSVATVTFTSEMSDEDLRENVGDSHAAGFGAVSEIEEFGPVGCAVLAASSDRLWGAGGQVPPGLVQFSKLKEDGEGAGFDALAGFQTVDTEGRAITLVHPHNDTTVVHQGDRLYIVAGTGPDNYGRGAFSIPQIMLADGAVTAGGHCQNQLGSLYWGAEGPRLLTTSFQVLNISAPVRALAEGLTPTAALANLAEHEVVWYTREGTALLWNYLDGKGRWAQWTGLPVSAASQYALCTTDGRLLYQDEDVHSDDGQSYEFTWALANLRDDQVLAGQTLVRYIGITGSFKGSHNLRFRVFFDGSPLWSEEWIWEPENGTWLTSAEELEDLTPAEVDTLLGGKDHRGAYLTRKRTAREKCSHFRVEVSDIEADGATYVPYELSLELGGLGGLGRVPVNTFTTTIGR